MTMTFTHEVHEVAIDRGESWRAEVAGYVVGVDRQADGHREVWVSPADRPSHRVIRCAPKDVADLERVADVLPELLRAAAAELRAAGLVDLRTTIDVLIDEQRTMIDAVQARHAAQRATIDTKEPPR
jgi:hypothetical protein